MSKEAVKEFKGVMNYFAMLQFLLSMSAYYRFLVASPRDPERVWDYLRSVENLFSYLLPKWKEDVEKEAGVEVVEMLGKYKEGIALAKKGRREEAIMAWEEAVMMCDRIKDAIIKVLYDKGVLMHTSTLYVSDLRSLYEELGT